jgi:cell division protease FtsH
LSYEPPRQALLDVPGYVANGWQLSPETRQRIDDAVREIVTQALARTTELLERERARLEAGAQALLERETLDEASLRAIVGADEGRAPPTMPAPTSSRAPDQTP